MPDINKDYVRKVVTKIFGELTDRQFKEIFPLFEWIEIEAGKQFIKQDEHSNYINFLVYGRLTAIRKEEKPTILGDIFPGEAVGENSTIADIPHTAHIYSARDSILIRLSKESLLHLSNKHPQLVLNLSKTIIERNEKNKRINDRHQPKNIVFILKKTTELNKIFLDKLQKVLQKYGRTNIIDSPTIAQKLGLTIEEFSQSKLNHNINIRLQNILDETERKSDYIIFIAKEQENNWTEKVLAQADIFYLIKDFKASEKLSSTEEKLFSNHLKYKLTEKNLVLLHPSGDESPKDTKRFLKNRHLKFHHHIRLDRHGDIERLARFITGNAIGLALSGGGAKGLAHVGVLMSLREHSIPVDFISGTSIGTFITALAAMDVSNKKLFYKGQDLAKKAPTRRKNMNFFPFVSLMRGRQMDALLEKRFGGKFIEDLWINSSYITANLTEKKKEIFTSGPLDKAIRASTSLPGIFPPAVIGNALYVDGGLFENLPVESLEKREFGKIITVTLNSTKKYNLNYDAIPDSWEYLKKQIIQKKGLKIPPITTVIMESLLLASFNKYKIDIPKSNLHLQPPVNKISLLDWDSYDKTVKIGKDYTDKIITDDIKKQLLQPRKQKANSL